MPDMDAPAPFLTFARFRLYLRVQSLMVLPPYKGAVFRGAFGNSLRRLVCVTRQPDCQPCLLRERCLYVSLFESPPPHGYAEARKFQKAPRPYVLNPPLTNRQAFSPGDILNFELVLIGPAVDALPYFIYLFEELGRIGLGPEKGRFDLLKVDCLNSDQSYTIFESVNRTLAAIRMEEGPVPDPTDPHINFVTMKLLTPLRLKENGYLVTHLTFPLLFERLAQRLGLLLSFYGDAARLPDLSPLLAGAGDITVSTNGLHWYDWERQSRRQGATMKFGGLKGNITFSGRLSPFLPYLRLGTLLNLGQGTTFGLGKYQLKAEAING